MIEKVFVDSNILIYAHDADSEQRIAANAIAEILDARSGVLSIQVLQEFYNTVTRKLRSAVTRDIARDLLRASVIYLPLLLAAMMLDAKGRLLF